MLKIFSLFLALFMIGCSTKEQVVVKPKPLPSWYLNPPKSTQRYVYVTGSGINKKEATLNALSNFIARYSVKISSSLSINKSSYNGGLYSRNAKYNVKAVIGKLEVSNYEVVKAYPYKFDKFLVLVRVDTKKLFDNLKSKLDERFRNYKSEFNAIKKESKVKQLIKLKELKKKLNKELEYINILKVMNEDFNPKPYLDFIKKVNDTYLNVKNTLFIEVDANNYAIKSDIQKYLSSHDIKIGKSPIKLKVNVTKRPSKEIMDLMVYNVYVTLEDNSKVIGTNSFKVIVPKSANLNDALYDEIKNLSLKEFFNI